MPMTPEPMQSRSEPLPVVDEYRARCGVGVYLAVTFGLAWLIELGPVRTMGLKTPVSVFLLIGVMFCPTLGALAARWYERSGYADTGLRWGNGWYHLLAWLGPFLVALAATIATVLLGAGTLDLTGHGMLEKLPEAQQAATRAQLQAVGPWFPLLVIVGALTQGMIITSFATFGEEFGWRGYLQPRLEHLGPVRSLVVVGLLWGVWHVPVIAQGHNYPGYPVLGSVAMVVFCVLLSIIFGWLFRASGSVLAPTLAHASLNSPAASLIVFAPDANPLVGHIIGVIGMALLAAVCVWLWRSGNLTAHHATQAVEF